MRLSPLAPLIAVACYAASEGATGNGKEETFLSVLAVGVVASAAALFAGMILGFLFGLPKTLDGKSGAKARLTTNTNLDQISDWLTKILVGLGLVQIGKLTHGINNLGGSLAPGLGNGSGAKAFAVAILMYSALDGFLIGYIWTRIDLSKRFRIAAEDLDPAEKATDVELAKPLPGPPEKAI
jgi:ABC-type amino acid transport system permease subunit